MLSITPFLWYETQAEEAANLYTSIFPRSKVVSVNRAGPQVMSVELELEGQKVVALNGRPPFQFNESFSFLISCETQHEIDDLWTKLTADGGSPGRCGWLKDKFGLSWQVVPSAMPKLLGGTDGARTKRVVEAMMQMSKLDLGRLQHAYDGA
jgi:predicted 3-demethylubiquinone-9 3-methyltransferase (glyoxalase superfamily)